MNPSRLVLRRVYAGALLFLTACGPDPAVLKSYVMGSHRNHIALMPFTIADKQADVRDLAEGTLRDRLAALGFAVVEKPELDDGTTVFGPSATPPRIEDVMDYGARCATAVVLVGRVERAGEGRPFEFGSTRRVQKERRDANGQVVVYDEEVVARPERPARPAHLLIKLKLFDTGTGRELWNSKQDPIPDEWTLDEAVRYAIEQQSLDLAATYAARKL